MKSNKIMLIHIFFYMILIVWLEACSTSFTQNSESLTRQPTKQKESQIPFSADENENSENLTPTTILDGVILSEKESDYLLISLEKPWGMNQSNSAIVNISNISEPLVLSLELTPLVNEKVVLQKPISIEGTPIAENMHEVTGFQIVQKINEGNSHLKIQFPSLLFDDSLYPSGVQGWLFHVILSDKIIVYPVTGSKQIGKKHEILPINLTNKPTIISSMLSGDIPKEFESYIIYSLPNATSGIFTYIFFDDIVDQIIFKSSSEFDFSVVQEE